MTLDQVFSLITFAIGAPFFVVFITTLRSSRLRRCLVVPKKWPDRRKAHRASSRLGP
jgi:hypothetical protein